MYLYIVYFDHKDNAFCVYVAGHKYGSFLLLTYTRYVKAGSPRLNIIILVALLLFPPIPILVAFVISADVYHVNTPTGVDVLCWVSDLCYK